MHRFTGRAEGDLGPRAKGVATRRAAVVARPWRTVRQIHGANVVVADEDHGGFGEEADAIVTADPTLAVAVFTADCAPVVFESSLVVGVAHAGWRGLLGGVLQNTVDCMKSLGAGQITATIGPCIHAECYDFGDDDLEAVARQLGPTVRSSTSLGHRALDVPAGILAALKIAGVTDVDDVDVCTACSPLPSAPDYFSHRARHELERQAGVVWL